MKFNILVAKYTRKGLRRMKKYNVQIKETLSMTIPIEARSAAQARGIAERNWANSYYILDASHFTDVSFTIAHDPKLGLANHSQDASADLVQPGDNWALER
ncbi:MAG: DpnD/PcfM family protein [Deltaproteobacteria bacterium]|nr:DpnD/PcfM family protein [Deltaproteobacteria bacterium]